MKTLAYDRTHGILKIAVRDRTYRYDVSPFQKDRFDYLLKKNQGLAMSFLRTNAKEIKDDDEQGGETGPSG